MHIDMSKMPWFERFGYIAIVVIVCFLAHDELNRESASDATIQATGFVSTSEPRPRPTNYIADEATFAAIIQTLEWVHDRLGEVAPSTNGGPIFDPDSVAFSVPMLTNEIPSWMLPMTALDHIDAMERDGTLEQVAEILRARDHSLRIVRP